MFKLILDVLEFIFLKGNKIASRKLIYRINIDFNILVKKEQILGTRKILAKNEQILDKKTIVQYLILANQYVL